MPSKSAQQEKKHSKQRRKRRAAALAAEESESESPIVSSAASSDEEPSKEAKVVASIANDHASSESTASTESELEQLETKPKKRKRVVEVTKQDDSDSSEASSISHGASPPSTAEEKRPDVNTEFESFYLKQMTAEFGNDLEKLRQAPDFKDAFVPVLVHALKQGASTFTVTEKQLVMGVGDDKH